MTLVGAFDVRLKQFQPQVAQTHHFLAWNVSTFLGRFSICQEIFQDNVL